MKAFAVLYDKGIIKEHIAFFDHLKTPVDLQFIGYGASLSLKEAVLSVGDGIDMLFLPGAQDTEEPLSYEFISCIKQLADSSDHVILVGSAAALMARTGLLRGVRIAVEGPTLAGLKGKFPSIHWEASDFHRAGRYWSTPGTPDNLLCLALILGASRKGHIDYFYPPRSGSAYGWAQGSPGAIKFATKLKATTGEKIGSCIVRYRSPDDVIRKTQGFMARLVTEGYLNDANAVLKKLCAVIPEAPDKLDPLLHRGFEFLWQEAGKRPDVPLKRPTAEQFKTWANFVSEDNPQNMEEKVELLETLVRRMQVGDMQLSPYGMVTAINLAAECGKEEEAKAWFEKQITWFFEVGCDPNWLYNIKSRAVARLILSGFVAAQITERVAEVAARDAADVISALETWSEKRSHPAPPSPPLSYDDMLTRLETRKPKLHDSLRMSPASEDAVWFAEARLGICLPEDYKAFLRVSNGMDAISSLDFPCLRIVQALRWEAASEFESDELRVALGFLPRECCDDEENTSDEFFNPQKHGMGLGHETGEYELLTRILMISVTNDSNWDEIENKLWFVEPSQVEKRGESGWRLVFWDSLHYNLIWYPSFKAYMDYIMDKHEVTDLPDED